MLVVAFTYLQYFNYSILTRIERTALLLVLGDGLLLSSEMSVVPKLLS